MGVSGSSPCSMAREWRGANWLSLSRTVTALNWPCRSQGYSFVQFSTVVQLPEPGLLADTGHPHSPQTQSWPGHPQSESEQAVSRTRQKGPVTEEARGPVIDQQ